MNRNRSPQHAVVHGTVDGYHNHKCRCEKCRAAWREYWREARWEQALVVHPWCEVPGCENGRYAKGRCKPHYERQRSGHPFPDGPVSPRPRARNQRMPGKDWINARSATA